MSSSQILFYLCLSFIGGVFLNSIAFVSQIILFFIPIFGIFFISIFYNRKRIVFVGFCLIFFALGIFHHQLAEIQVIDSELRKLNDKDEIISFVGIVNSEPDVRENSVKLEISPQFSNKERILVTTGRYENYQYGDELEIKGSFQTPVEFEGFNYKDYLKKEGVYSVMYAPEIKVISQNNGNFLLAGIFKIKNRLRKSIYSFLSPPQSSILGAMILGDKRKISESQKEKLNRAGVRHITAVSGLHVSIFTVILMTLLTGLGLLRKHAFYLTIIFIVLFVLLTGLQPSAIRAGIMGSFFLFAQYLGRLNFALRALVLAASVMLLFNPFLLTLDIGFQLSFLAMTGIIYFMPTFKEVFKIIPFENIRSVLAMTFSAYVFALPVLIYNFGSISLVSPLTNILIVPLLYWIMVFGFLFIIISSVFPFLGMVFSIPVWMLLTYLVKVVDIFSSFSFSSLSIENIHWIWIVIFYSFLGIIVFKLQERERLRFLNF